ncbi:MAG: FkbM family methyltransferase [Bacteroidota bacterium]
MTIKTLHGFNMIIDPVRDEGVERTIYYTGSYEKGTLFVIKNLLKEGDTFIDVGANIGLMSIFASSIVMDSGKIIAFEPNPVTLKILKRNIALNNISNIQTSDYAVGAKASGAKIYDRWDSNRGSASLIKPESESDSYDIEVITLSDYCKANQEIHLIKIDIEGFELEALKGAKEILDGESPPMLIIECSETRENTYGFGTDDLYEFLKCITHYRLFKSRGGKEKVSKLVEIRTRSELPHHDNIYCFTKKHMEQIPSKIFSRDLLRRA